MKKFKPIFILGLILALSLPVLAARLEVKGVVISAKTGEPLVGANVFIKDTNAGAATDLNGHFSFVYVTEKEFMLVTRFMGYKTFEKEYLPTDDLSNLKIEMKEDVFHGEEVVVTGIASKTSKAVAEVAVSRLSADQYTVATSYQDVSQLINGKVAGVNVEQASGNVGGGIRFNVRSGGGLNGDEQPVIYVDGVRIDNSEFEGRAVGGQGISMLADLNPEDIETIEVLKGPAGASSYGTSGSNGVVLITTKRGQLVPGEAKGISINYKVVSGYNEQSYKYDEDDFLSYKDINAIFRKGRMLQHSLNASGGTGLMRYFISFNRRYEDGILPNNYMDRKSVRANFDVYPSDKFHIGVNTGYTLNENRRPNNDNNIFGFLGNTILTSTPYWFTDSASVRGLFNLAKSNRFIGSINADYRPFKNFEIRFDIGIDDGDIRNDMTYPSNLFYSFYPSGDRAIYNRLNTQLTSNFYASYKYNITPGFKATSIIGAQIHDRKTKTSYIEKKDYLTELITNIGAGENFQEADESYTHMREAGIFTDHSFSFLEQYYFSLMLRQDYASAVGLEAPSIFYPKASFAIRLDKYGFCPSMFNLMKIRAAYGETGVLPGLVDGIPLLWEAEPSGYGAGAVLSAIGDREIKPERIKEFEIGLESEVLDNYSVELTYYKQKSEDSIIDFWNAPSTGKTASAVPFNIGAIDGWGIESLIQACPLSTKNYQLGLSLTNCYQTNEVKDLGGAQPIYDPFDINVIKEGLPKHAFYTKKVIGALFNEDGTYAGVDVEDERSFMGTPIPKYTGSFSMNFRFLKNFNLYLLTDWATGHKIFNNTKLFAIYMGSAFGIGANNKRYQELEDLLDIADWDTLQTPLTPGTQEYKDVAEEYAKMDRRYDANFLEKADFFKLREISLSYSFKDLLPERVGISDLVLGISARNIFTITEYSGADVEVNFDGSRSLCRGQDFLTLQQPKVYNIWLRMSF
jgi:TonB-dependent SusC/RagA subfamily outer membrane receptor